MTESARIDNPPEPGGVRELYLATTTEEQRIASAYLSGKLNLCRERGHSYEDFESVDMAGYAGFGQTLFGTCRWCGHKTMAWGAKDDGWVSVCDRHGPYGADHDHQDVRCPQCVEGERR